MKNKTLFIQTFLVCKPLLLLLLHRWFEWFEVCGISGFVVICIEHVTLACTLALSQDLPQNRTSNRINSMNALAPSKSRPPQMRRQRCQTFVAEAFFPSMFLRLRLNTTFVERNTLFSRIENCCWSLLTGSRIKVTIVGKKIIVPRFRGPISSTNSRWHWFAFPLPVLRCNPAFTGGFSWTLIKVWYARYSQIQEDNVFQSDLIQLLKY